MTPIEQNRPPITTMTTKAIGRAQSKQVASVTKPPIKKTPAILNRFSGE
jgi:hypothetical protein